MDAASERLRELMVERKTHEKLKEKALEEYQKESLDVERKETDEIVSCFRKLNLSKIQSI